MDEKVFAGVKENSKRNRRVAAMVMIVGGATVGGYMTKHGDIGTALWAVTAVKVVMAATWLFWTPKEGRVRLP
jgi:predicted MFS family arabinose efflux permease